MIDVPSAETGPVREPDDWTNGVVAILNGQGIPVGTGFVANREGLIVTCAHVLDAAGWPFERWDQAISLRFHANRRRAEAQALEGYFRVKTEEDVAVLAVAGELPPEVEPLPLLSAEGSDDHPVKMLGYPDNYRHGLLAKGDVFGMIQRDSYDTLQLWSEQSTHRYSGGPIWDTVSRRVIGIVKSGREADEAGRHAFTMFAVPTETLIAVCDQLVVTSEPPSEEALDSDLLPLTFSEYDKWLFVGRQAQIDYFKKVLEPGDELVGMHILDEPGMGKTWFLHRLCDECHQLDTIPPFVRIDFSQEARDVVNLLGLLRFVRNEIIRRTGTNNHFLALNEKINEFATGETETLIAQLVDQFTDDHLTELCRDLLAVDYGALPGERRDERVRYLIDHHLARPQLITLLRYLDEHHGDQCWEFGHDIRRSSVREANNIAEQLTRAFLSSLEQLVAETKVLVFLFDSFNDPHIASEVRDWIRIHFVPWLRSERADGVAVIVTETRAEPEEDDSAPELPTTTFRMGARIPSGPLGTLQEQDIRNYLERRSLDPDSLSDEDKNELFEKGKRPSYLALLVDGLKSKSDESDDLPPWLS